MTPFKRQFPVGISRDGTIWVTVKYDLKDGKGRLSMTGVVGPTYDGNSIGSCGQCQDSLLQLLADHRDGRKGIVLGFQEEAIQYLYDVWETWHLNDMKAGCEHQDANWSKERQLKPLTLYRWKLSPMAYTLKKAAEDAALAAARKGETFLPTAEQLEHLNLSILGMATIVNEAPNKYLVLEREEANPACQTRFGPDEGPQKWSTGMFTHPEGLLGKPCEVCGWKYGSAWGYRPVPEEILQWLAAIPSNQEGLPGAWREKGSLS